MSWSFFIASSFNHISYYVVDLETIRKRLVATLKEKRFYMEAGNYLKNSALEEQDTIKKNGAGNDK